MEKQNKNNRKLASSQSLNVYIKTICDIMCRSGEKILIICQILVDKIVTNMTNIT